MHQSILLFEEIQPNIHSRDPGLPDFWSVLGVMAFDRIKQCVKPQGVKFGSNIKVLPVMQLGYLLHFRSTSRRFLREHYHVRDTILKKLALLGHVGVGKHGFDFRRAVYKVIVEIFKKIFFQCASTKAEKYIIIVAIHFIFLHSTILGKPGCITASQKSKK